MNKLIAENDHAAGFRKLDFASSVSLFCSDKLQKLGELYNGKPIPEEINIRAYSEQRKFAAPDRKFTVKNVDNKTIEKSHENLKKT